MPSNPSPTNSIPEEFEMSDSVNSRLSQFPPRRSLPEVPSLLSTGYYFANDENFHQKPTKHCKVVLLRGPRRLFRLCFCGLFLPVILISIPLYIRLILYPPVHYMMAPTDQRLLDHTSSSFWCRGQTVNMNGSFNAYLLPDSPQISKNYSTHSMLQHITLKDDVKEYWGFYFLKDSVVSINLCTRYDGGMLMIMRGVNNLHKCAWIGEEDSAEQDEDDKDISNESGQGKDYMHDIPMVPGELLMEVKKDENPISKQDFVPTENGNLTSEERREELDYYIRKVLKLSKNKKEIIEELNKTNLETEVTEKPKPKKKKLKPPKKKKKKGKLKKLKENQTESENINRTKRFEKVDETNDVKEETSYNIDQSLNLFNSTISRIKNASDSNGIYLSVLKITKGLTYERGNINQASPNDTSDEEHRSSFSSSEESLMKCDGLIGVLPLYPSRKCNNFNETHSNIIKYRVPVSGTYYFVFSSDNEVFDLDMFFNMTLQRVVVNTEGAVDSCTNKSNCSLLFSFLSNDQAVVEVPQGDWNVAYTMEIRCQPRVSVYLIFLFLIPILILFCAFH